MSYPAYDGRIDFHKWLDRRIDYAYHMQNRLLEQLEKQLEEPPKHACERELKITESQLRFEKKLKLYGIELWFPKRVKHEKIIPEALSDWDIDTDSGNWGLSEGRYVSSPSALYVYCDGGQHWYSLCKYTGTTNLPQGKIITYFLHINSEADWKVGVFIRNQQDVGAVSTSNTYIAYFNFGAKTTDRTLHVELYENGSKTWEQTSSFTYTFDAFTWYHFQFVWWEEYLLFIRLYIEEAGEWKQYGATHQHTSPKWSDSAVNRCGLYIFQPVANYITCIWVDDTEIWGP